MKVGNFIALFNIRTKKGGLSQDELMAIIIDLIKPKQYLAYDKKIEIVMATIKQAKDMKPLLPLRSRLFIVNLISVYTNLEMTIDDFDVLSQNLLLEPILASFQREYEICSSIMQMCLEEGDDL